MTGDTVRSNAGAEENFNKSWATTPSQSLPNCRDEKTETPPTVELLGCCAEEGRKGKKKENKKEKERKSFFASGAVLLAPASQDKLIYPKLREESL